MMSDTAFAVGFLGIYLLFVLIMYLVGTIPYYVLAKKANHKHPWLAFVPIANSIQMLQIAGINPWAVLLLLVPLVNIVFGIYMTCKFLIAFGRSGFEVLILIIPVANYIYLFYLAFSSNVHYERYYSPPPPDGATF